MFCKYLSKEDLKTSTATPLRLRTSGGSELNSLGPLCGREAKRIFLIRSGAEDDRGVGHMNLSSLVFKRYYWS